MSTPGSMHFCRARASSANIGVTAPQRVVGGAFTFTSQWGKPLGGITKEPPGRGASARLAQTR